MNLHEPVHRTSVLQQLPTTLQLRVLSFLSSNDRALSGRLVSPDAADALNGPQHCTAFLSQPLPAHAVPWMMEAGQQQVRQLPFCHKPHLLCTAAASGSEANLEVALTLLQPSIFPELLQHWDTYLGPDVGVAAIRAGHPQLLSWLLRRCPGLSRPDIVLAAAAQHCDLAGLQFVYEVLMGHDQRSKGGLMQCLGWHQVVLNAAAESATADAPEKMQWLIATFNGSCRLQESTAVVAAHCGDLGRLRWLHSLGCPVGNLQVLESALQHADLAVAAWLVDEAGCSLPKGGPADLGWKALLAAVKSSDGLEKLTWLRERGAPSPTADLVHKAVSAGQAEVASFLLQAPRADAVLLARGTELGLAAVQSRSIPTVELLWKAGVRFTQEAYWSAAGSLPMVRWLVCHMGVPVVGVSLGDLLCSWPTHAPARSRDLLGVVQLLVDRPGHCVPPSEYRRALKLTAEQGDLVLVQYLLQQQRRAGHTDYQPDVEFLTAAQKGGCEALLEWLAEQHPGCLAVAGSQGSPYRFAAKSGDRATLEALRRLGVPWGTDGVVARALRAGSPVPALRWLLEQGAPVGSAGHMEGAVVWGLSDGRLSAEEAAWLRGLAPAGAA